MIKSTLEVPVHHRSRSLIALGAAILSIVLAACSAQDDPGGFPTAGPLELRVGVPKTGNALSAYVAQAEGIFAAHNIKAEFVPVVNGAEALPMLVNNQIDVTLGDGFGTITAAGNGLPITVFGIATIQPKDISLDPAIIFTKDDSVKATDFSGKKFAVGALGGYHELAARSTIDTLGGASSKVQYVELAPASMADAVKKGDVAAALITEPYTTQAEKRGLHPLEPQAVGTQGVSGVLWVAKKDYAAKNPDVLEAFADAVEEAGHVVNKDRDLARKVAATFMTVEPEVIKVMRFPTFTDTVSDFSSLERLADLAVLYKMLPKKPDLSLLTLKVNG
jgi:ABC-type nitrate/sulfonate/bicarbonate transport system substrate-binding protein